MLKKCNTCKKEKPLVEFGPHKGFKDGRRAKCNGCRREDHKANKAKNALAQRAKYLKRKTYYLSKAAQYRKDNPDKNKDYYHKHQERLKEIMRRNAKKPENKLKYNKKAKERYATEPLFRAKKTIKNSVSKAYRGGDTWFTDAMCLDLLGCTCEQYTNYINTQLTGNMHPENYGRLWNIDFITPIGMCATLEEVFIYSHFTNTQPMLVSENYAKKDAFIG